MMIRILFYLFTFTVSISFGCNNRADKYIEATVNWDGPRCKTFDYFEFKSVEVALCKETGIFLASSNCKHAEFAEYFDNKAIAVYIRENENLRIFNNEKFIAQVFSKAAKSGKIYEIGITDSTFRVAVYNNEVRKIEFKYIISNLNS